MSKLSWLPKISLFESFVLVSVCAVLIWANARERISNATFSFKGLDGELERSFYGWPFDMVEKSWAGFYHWNAWIAGNAVVFLLVILATLCVIRWVLKVYSKRSDHRI